MTDTTTAPDAIGAAVAARDRLAELEAAADEGRESYYAAVRAAIDDRRAAGVKGAQQRVAEALGISRSRVSELARRAG